MSNPLDVQETLDHCMTTIKGASEVMADDVHDAAMRLGVAGMMLASASNAVYRRAFPQAQAPTQPDTGEQADGA
jgi:hypothetical protein